MQVFNFIKRNRFFKILLKIAGIGALILFPFSVTAQTVYSVKYENRADVRVFVVEHENQADLKVYKVKYPNRAKGNKGLWFFTEYDNRAEKKVYFVDYQNRADLKIFFVKYRNRAGWNNKSRMHLMY